MEKEEIIVVLFAKGIKEHYNGTLSGETIGCGLLDSGCSKSVCSKAWLELYKETLSQEEEKLITYSKSSTQFRFGGGNVYTSIGRAKIPAHIGSKRFIETDIVECELPLLLSKNAMKKANTVINFENDKVTMFGKDINLIFTSTGHHVVPLNTKSRITYDEEEISQKDVKVLFSNANKLQSSDTAEKKKIAKKLHCQFGHTSSKRIKKLLTDGNIQDECLFKLLEDLDEDCQICKKFKKPPPKLIVCIPLAKELNESVAMDLKEIDSRSVLHMLYHATRFSKACVIPSKKKEVIVSKICETWISLFATPKRILSDNGGEFNNEDLREMGEKLNTTITTAAAESPWSNCINERHNAILGDKIVKIK